MVDNLSTITSDTYLVGYTDKEELKNFRSR